MADAGGSPRAAAPSPAASPSFASSPSAAQLRASARASERSVRHARKAEEAAAAAKRLGERATLLARRDALAYYDTARALGPQVFVDVVPSALNAIACITVGLVLKARDGVTLVGGADHVCPAAAHDYAMLLFFSQLALVGYLTWVTVGPGRGGANISVPWLALVCWYAGVAAIGVFFGLPAVFSVVAAVDFARLPAASPLVYTAAGAACVARFASFYGVWGEGGVGAARRARGLAGRGAARL